MAITSLAALALMASGSTPDRGEHQEAIRRAVSWIGKRQHRVEGRLVANDSSGMGEVFEHACGTLFLAHVYGELAKEDSDPNPEIRDEKMRMQLFSALRYLVRYQQPDGSWGRGRGSGFDAGVTVMAYLAIRAGQACGWNDEGADLKKLERLAGKYKEADPGGRGFYHTACMARLFYGLYGPSMEAREIGRKLRQLKYGADHNKMSEWDYLAAFYSVGAFLHDERDRSWRDWYSYTRDFLIRIQHPSQGFWIIEYCLQCKAFATALALLTLQMPNRLLPVQQY